MINKELNIFNKQHTVLVSHKDIVLSADAVKIVFENGKYSTEFTESACPLRVYRHLKLFQF